MAMNVPVRVVLVVTLASALGACGGGGTGAAEDYPTESIRFVVPYAAGGPTDHTSRTVGSCLQEELGQSVVVENRPGGSGALGTTDLISSQADGHTLALITAGTTVLTPLANEVGYTKDDVRPIGVMAEVPSVLAAGERSPHQDAESFFEAARARPDALTVGVPGASTPQAIELQRLADEHDVVVNVIPFDGNAEMTTALLGGNVDAVLINASADVVSNVEAGSFIPLAASPAERLPWLPDTPTLEELGFGGLTLSGSTFGLAGPADLPDEITSTLEDTLRTCLDKPDIRETLDERYVPEEFVGADGLQQVLDDTQEVYEPILGEG
jgi:tripartite-type tricarboxylate transporter receptor subunit TctC